MTGIRSYNPDKDTPTRAKRRRIIYRERNEKEDDCDPVDKYINENLEGKRKPRREDYEGDY
ncbi:hypothetical protein J4407_01945 [Candidatus Pacearchaeota archaeon]|nr:hypothetical protein [Candidatus Pacearchaeota archaeon]